MFRWTTPVVEISTDISLVDADVIWLTFAQNDTVLVNKEKPDMTVTAEGISVTLTQQETALFDPYVNLDMQIRAKFGNFPAIACDIMSASVKDVLKEGEI